MRNVKIPVKQIIDAELLSKHELLAAKRCDEGSNVGRHLFDLFYWQEAREMATFELDKAWAAAQGDQGPIDTDDDLRGLGKGEHIIAESDQFSCLATVQDPRLNFDREMFITCLVKTYKLKREAVDKIAEACRTPTRAPLKKRVVEA